MIVDRERFNRAINGFEAVHAEDPNRKIIDGIEYPKELLYARQMIAMLGRFVGDASEALQLAACCQHIQRWKIERANYPMTRAGYLHWRTRLRDFHAEIASSILREAAYDDNTIARVCSLLKKEHLQQDAEAQALEDVAILVFLENDLEDFVSTHRDYDAAKLLEILRKILKKMSTNGRSAVLTMINLPPTLLPTIEKAIGSEMLI